MPRKSWFIVVVITFIVVVIWLISSVFKSQPSIDNLAGIEKVLDPINPKFDPKILGQLDQVYTPNQTIPAIPVTEASPSANIIINNLQPQASDSGITNF